MKERWIKEIAGALAIAMLVGFGFIWGRESRDREVEELCAEAIHALELGGVSPASNLDPKPGRLAETARNVYQACGQ